MSMVDPLADMYTRIRNASRIGKETVDMPSSNLKKEVARILKQKGFIDNFKVLEDDKQGIIRIKLKYGKKKTSMLTNIKQISKPGLRIYVNSEQIPKVLGGYGIAVITTSKGLLTDRECREQHIGGEILCYVW